jgi:hypothetical protein
MSMSKVTLWGNLELGGICIGMSGMELSKAMGGIGPRLHKGVKGKGFRGNVGKNVQRMSGNNVREVRDDSNAVPGIRSLVQRCISGWSSVRKSRGRIRT